MSKVLRALSASNINLLMQMAARFNWDGLDFASLARSRVTTYLVSRYRQDFEEKEARSAVDALDMKGMQYALETCNEASDGSASADCKLLDILGMRPPNSRPSNNPQFNTELALSGKRKRLQRNMDDDTSMMRVEIARKDQRIHHLQQQLDIFLEAAQLRSQLPPRWSLTCSEESADDKAQTNADDNAQTNTGGFFTGCSTSAHVSQ